MKNERRPKKKFSKGKKEMMATWDDSESEEEDSDEEQANVALMATTADLEGSEEPKDNMLSELESDSGSEEIFSELSHFDLESYISEILEKYQSSE